MLIKLSENTSDYFVILTLNLVILIIISFLNLKSMILTMNDYNLDDAIELYNVDFGLGMFFTSNKLGKYVKKMFFMKKNSDKFM